ncbi:MAG: caspase family protein [Treponema sp.]|jgi:hypothetical protein|nr:caspase family protein [Treponema sp.]
MKNNLIQKTIVAFCLMGIGVMAWGVDDSTRRLGIFIGSNNGGNDRTVLRYAVSDAHTVSRVFAEMGGVRGTDNILLVEPDIQELVRVIDRAQELVQNAKQTARRTELVFYYSGHSDETGLLLGQQRYSYQELRERINRIPSDMRIVILDSCASGAFTRTKGGIKTQPFLIDTSVSVEGYAFLTSSSATESSQESDRIESSYFTHNLVAGLRGAADTAGDGQVTLNEVYRFAYTETLAVTETSLYGAQHPSYDMQVSGSGDVVLTNVRENSASLLIEAAISGRLSIRDSKEYLIAEITKTAGKPIELGLETGSYRITLQQGDTFYRATLFLVPDTQTRLSMRDFTLIAASPATARGPEPEHDADYGYNFDYFDFDYDYDFNFDYETDDDEPVGYGVVSFQLGSSPNSTPPRVTNNLLVGFIGASTYNLNGVGVAGGYTFVANNMNGIQVAGLVNAVGRNMYGVSAAGLVNAVVGGDMYGISATGLVNAVGGDMYGIQGSALVNAVGGDMYGISATGLVNVVGGNMYGIQGSALVNVAGMDMQGIIASGLVNVAGGDMYGVSAAGLFNVTAGDMYGVQGSALGNVNGGDAGGIQAAGLFNVTAGSQYGIQAAGLFNFAMILDGFQAAGLFNVAKKSNWYDHNRPYNVIGDLFRWQVAGVFNLTNDDFYGVQVAPVNISGQNKKSGLSLQLGVVNISANERAMPIGLVNIVKNGILNPAIYYDTYEMLNVSFRSGSKYFYSLFSVASSQANLGELSIGKADAGDLLAFRAGVGFEFPLGQFFLDLDVTAGTLFDIKDWGQTKTTQTQYTNTIQGRITLGLKFFKHLGVFAGVSYDYFNRNQTLSPMPKYSWDDVLPSNWSNEQHVHKLGFFAGVQF